MNVIRRADNRLSCGMLESVVMRTLNTQCYTTARERAHCSMCRQINFSSMAMHAEDDTLSKHLEATTQHMTYSFRLLPAD